MRPEIKVGDDVYIARHIYNNMRLYTVYDIDEEFESYTIVEKGSVWNYDEGYFQLPDGEPVPIKRLKYEDLMCIQTGLDFLIDRFAFLINQHVNKTSKGYWEWKPIKDDIVERITQKIYDNR